MLTYIYRTLVHYRVQAASLLLGLFAIHMGTCMGLFSLEQTRVSVTQDIAQYSRDVYDILVRPDETGQNPIRADDRDYMEPNYVCKNYDGDSGISIETWREIQSIPGVEIAAPIAALGFFTNTIDSVQIERPAGRSLRFILDFFTSDGYKEYKIDKSTSIAIASLPDLKVPKVAASSIDENIGFSMMSESERIYMSFHLPQIYNFLVAIDPESEAKLVGLSDALQKGRYLSPGPVPVEKISFGAKITADAYQIPLLINEQTPIPLSVKITEEKLDLPPDLTDSIRLLSTPITKEDIPLKKKIDEELMRLPAANKITKEIELTKYLKAFQTTGIDIDPQWEISTTSQGLQRIAPATEFYTTRGIRYKAAQDDDSLIFYPEPTGIRDGQVQFHDLQVRGKPAVQLAEEGKPVFQFNPIGTVSFQGPKQNELAKSPLGIYGSEEMLLESDINGKKLSEPVKLHPTITPGTVQMPAAHGFTTLEAAKIIEGDRPIDAIRVRVAGVTRFDEKGQAKIRQVAEDIVARTGLRVDIIAGTSMQEVRLDIPGYKDVPPLGRAMTSWISLGAATRIQNIFSLFSIALTLLFVVVGFIFVHNRSSIYLWQRKSELDILKTQGWQGGTIAKMISLEVLMIWSMAALLSMAANVLLHETLNAEWSKLLSLWLIVTFAGGMTFAATTRRGVSKFFKSREGSQSRPGIKSGSEYRKTEGISAVVRKDLMYYGGRLRFMAVQLIIGGTISIFAWLARAAVAHQAVTTRLGDFIHARAGIWLMLIGAASTILVILTCLDSILSYLDLRRRDLVLLQQLGWRLRHLQRLVIPQILFPVVVALLSAFGAAYLMVLALYGEYPLPPGPAISFILAFPAAIGISTNIWISSLYSAQGSKANKNMRSRPAKTMRWIALAAVVVLGIGLTVMYHSGIKGPKSIGPVNSDSSGPDISGTGREALRLINMLTKLGSRPAGSEANQKETQILRDWLQKAGLDVQSEPVEVPPVRSLGPGSKLEVSGTSLDFSYLALDLSVAKAGDKYILDDDHAVILTGEKTGDAETSGHIVLVEAASDQEFRKSLRSVLRDDPLAVVGVNPGTLPDKIGPVGLSLDVVEVIPSFHSENMWVDIPGTSPEKQEILIAANHGSIGPGAGDNASGAAAAALLARTLKQDPLPVQVRILWAAGGDAQYNGGLAMYLDKHTLPRAAAALSRLGSKEPLAFGFRDDTTYGRPRDINPVGEDLKPEDIIPFVKQQPQHHSELWDLGYPSVRRRVMAEDRDILTTPDEWMAAAEKTGREMGMDFRPAFPSGLGVRLMDAGIPTAPLWRPSPYANTKKDTADRIIPQTIGKDILFIERILREIAGKEGLPWLTTKDPSSS